MAMIKDVNMLNQYVDDMTLYAIYVALHRLVPDYRDGFKDVQRKIIYAMHKIGPSRTVKSSSVVGTVMDKYHPHGDTSIYGAMKPMVNWFETNIPLIDKQGNFGNFQGDGASAMRYTEAKINKFAEDVVIGDLKRSNQVVDWEDNYSGTCKVPEYLPPNLPMLLINGSFGIAVGFKVEIPRHNINEVIDATINLIDHPNAKVVLVPEQSMECEIIDADFEKISKTGFGNFKVRGKIDIGEFKGKTALFIRSLPDLVYLDQISDKIEKLIEQNKLTQVHDVYENSDGDRKLEYIITLKKGADPKFVRDTIYKYTEMEKSVRVNFEVLCDRHIVRMGYKEYLSRFIDFRKTTKLRLYYNLLQEAKTKMHEREAFIKVLSSGEIDKIIKMIKSSKKDEAYIIEYLVKKYDITDLQAKTIIDTPIKYLSQAYLAKYKEDAKKHKQAIESYLPRITNEEILNEEIKEELRNYKKLYGRPRHTKVISSSQAADIPEGEFKIVITDNNFVRKLDINEPIKAIRGDNPKLVIRINNTDNLLIFDAAGKSYSIPVHRIPLSDRGNVGTDIRFLNKKLTSNIVSIYPELVFKDFVKHNSNTYMIVLTHNGLIKKMDLNDFTSLTAGGIFYTKLGDSDYVQDIIIGGDALDVVVYSDKKALRFPVKDIPLVRRSAKGVISIGSKSVSHVDGLCLLTKKDKTDVVVVTRNGYINRFDISALPTSQRAKAGSSVIKLSKTDNIVSIHNASAKDIIHLVTEKGPIDINIGLLPIGSSISQGTKSIDGRNSVVKTSLIKG